MSSRRRYPRAVDPTCVGRYSPIAKSGGGFVWDEVLEYRVWCHQPEGGDDYYVAFANYPRALVHSKRMRKHGAEEPLALIRQRQYIDEDEPEQYVHIKRVRVTEWPRRVPSPAAAHAVDDP